MNHARFKKIFPREIIALFSDTSTDFLLPPDADGLSAGQKNALLKLNIDPQKVFTMRQVHGNKVLAVTSADIPQAGHIPDADAMVTNVPEAVLSVRTADCLPVFLYDPEKKCIGLVHAGWKGSALKIVERTLDVLKKDYGSQPADVLAAFGPSIRECCYEVGEEFTKTFPGEVFQRKNTLCLNLPLVNRNQLLNSGVKNENIFESGECTVCNNGFYSFRRDQEKAGRHVSLISMHF